MDEATVEINKDMATLYAKMARVMGKMTRVQKDGVNDFHHYKYATADDVADMIRAAMAEVNLAFFADMVSSETVPHGKGTRTTSVFLFTFACGDTGATLTKQWIAIADDTGDKGVNKSATAAEKYFLMKTFIVSTGAERDADAEDDMEVVFADKGKLAKFLSWAKKQCQYSEKEVIEALAAVVDDYPIKQVGHWRGSEIDALGAVIAAFCKYDAAAIEKLTASNNNYRIEHFQAALAAAELVKQGDEFEQAVAGS